MAMVFNLILLGANSGLPTGAAMSHVSKPCKIGVVPFGVSQSPTAMRIMQGLGL
jgi:hypothetical protein